MIGLAIFGGIIAIPLIVAVGSILNGYVLSVLWTWFVVPTFGLPKLSIPVAIGISLVVSYLTHQRSDSSDDDKDNLLLKWVARLVLNPLVALLFGWIVHFFV